MAEIKIRKKKLKWPYIVLALVVIVFLAYMFFPVDHLNPEGNVPIVVETDESIRMEVEDKDTATYSKTAEETAKYLSFIGDRSKLGVDADYTRNAMIQLINLVRSVAIENQPTTEVDLENLKDRAFELKENTTASDLAKSLKDIGGETTEVIQKIQVAKFPDLHTEIKRIERAIEAIAPTIEIVDQKEEFTEYFVSCGDAIKKMDLTRK